MKQGIELDQVTRIVDGETYLSNIQLKLEPGSFYVLLGRTRAGKTSLLRLLAGLDRPSSGAVRQDGVDVTRRSVGQRNVAMVYQQFVNYPSLTVYENIASPLRLRSAGHPAGALAPAEIDRKVRETAKKLRLDALLERLPAELSGGQQQRTAMARALAKDADLLLLDEPLANLDYKLREEMRAEIRRLFQGRGEAVVVYATADPVEALLLGGNVVVIDEGRILQHGPTLDVYRAPANERVGEVFSDPQMNVLPADVTGADSGASRRIRVSGDVEFPLPAHLSKLRASSYRLGIRANHVRLAERSEGDIRVSAHVEIAETSGSETLVHATHGKGTNITAQVEGVIRLAPGTEIDLFLDAGRLFAFQNDGRLAAAPTELPGDTGFEE
ncbi:ABC transporter ATP-binding protein [Pendulispora albinea]|uniref:ABC transporter ATP-binding protein n=1 Tax=Pendulispora albinea TaxID=2741071 RepID=A0ABZ2LRQ5_9BACT